jgi:hypothetical protein
MDPRVKPEDDNLEERFNQILSEFGLDPRHKARPTKAGDDDC